MLLNANGILGSERLAAPSPLKEPGPGTSLELPAGPWGAQAQPHGVPGKGRVRFEFRFLFLVVLEALLGAQSRSNMPLVQKTLFTNFQIWFLFIKDASFVLIFELIQNHVSRRPLPENADFALDSAGFSDPGSLKGGSCTDSKSIPIFCYVFSWF